MSVAVLDAVEDDAVGTVGVAVLDAVEDDAMAVAE